MSDKFLYHPDDANAVFGLAAKLEKLQTRLYELEHWTRSDEDKIYGKIADLEKMGEEWVRLFKKLNSDRMLDHLALKAQVDRLEKLIVEPRAQALVDAVGSRYKPIAHDCPHCKRPMK